jgi:hypothetical protein
MSQFSELETSTAIRVRRAKITDIPGILAVLDYHLLAKKDRFFSAKFQRR